MKISKAWAPGRVNIIGEHTDYTGGYVFPMAIELGVTATITLRSDRILNIVSNLMPDKSVLSIDELSPENPKSWSSYAAGAVWSVARTHPLPNGMDISLESNLPVGAGMSSSAAVECAVVLAVCDLLGISVSKREVAKLAKDAENIYVGVPTGSMDQVASMYGEPGKALFFDTRDDEINPISIDLSGHNALFAIIDTKAKHALIDGGYAARRSDCETANKLLEVEYLRDLSDLDKAIEILRLKGAQDRVVKRVRHVISENARVLSAVRALEENNLIELGRLMNQSHESLKNDFEVSCMELDVAVESARNVGAYGARMMGGGFGGSAITLIDQEKVSELTAEVTSQFAANGFNTPMVYLVTASKGAHVIESR